MQLVECRRFASFFDALGVTFSHAHGQLAGLVTAPNPIRLDDWLEALFLRAPQTDRIKEFDPRLLAIVRMHDQMIDEFHAGQFRPLHWDAVQQRTTYLGSSESVEQWCQGYFGGLGTVVRDYMTPDNIEIFLPVAILSKVGGLRVLPPHLQACLEEAEGAVDTWTELLPQSLQLIRELWREDRQAFFQHLGIEEKQMPCYMASNPLGRNDRCFCGSGKKYKKCCMVEGQS